ncbi:MAG: hypothetical protein ACOYMG_28385, partial [Candidatus Methylumidiphilus sp.]
IREYTELQYQLRSGVTMSPSILQIASNEIAANFLTEIVNGGGVLPNLDTVGRVDAASAAANLFNGLASSTHANNYSPWAGTVLFTNLGDAEFFNNWIANDGTSFNKQESGAYDLIAAAQAASIKSVLAHIIDVLSMNRFSRQIRP